MQTMLSKYDKIAILHLVNIFSETPEEILADLAELLQPVVVSAGERIITKGESGDCMYIVVEGRLRAHDGDMFLNYLGVSNVFGEMALLDQEPRSASITAEEESFLLRLDRGPFMALMTSQVEMALGVIRVLNRYLRNVIEGRSQDFAYIQQMTRLTNAAAALEAGRYDQHSLDQICMRNDQLGQLARVFQSMANEVITREQRLKRQVNALRIRIDEEKKASQVKEITDSDFFQSVQRKAMELRAKKK